MPETTILKVPTRNLQMHDVIKIAPNGKGEPANGRFLGKKITSIQDRLNVWITLTIEDTNLPTSKRWNMDWKWVIWRTQETEAEKAHSVVEDSIKRVERWRSNSKSSMVNAHNSLAENLRSQTFFAVPRCLSSLANAVFEEEIWCDIEKIVKDHNQTLERSNGHIPDLQDIWTDDPRSHEVWNIVDGMRYFIWNFHRVMRNNWSKFFPGSNRSTDAFKNITDDMLHAVQYEFCGSGWSSKGREVEKYMEAIRNLQAAKDEFNSTESISS